MATYIERNEDFDMFGLPIDDLACPEELKNFRSFYKYKDYITNPSYLENIYELNMALLDDIMDDEELDRIHDFYDRKYGSKQSTPKRYDPQYVASMLGRSKNSGRKFTSRREMDEYVKFPRTNSPLSLLYHPSQSGIVEPNINDFIDPEKMKEYRSFYDFKYDYDPVMATKFSNFLSGQPDLQKYQLENEIPAMDVVSDDVLTSPISSKPKSIRRSSSFDVSVRSIEEKNPYLVEGAKVLGRGGYTPLKKRQKRYLGKEMKSISPKKIEPFTSFFGAKNRKLYYDDRIGQAFLRNFGYAPNYSYTYGARPKE